MVQFHATTICAVRRGPNDVCIGGDGQVTMGETAIMKNGAKKVKITALCCARHAKKGEIVRINQKNGGENDEKFSISPPK